jgi:excisionase family DNA binding protein
MSKISQPFQPPLSLDDEHATVNSPLFEKFLTTEQAAQYLGIPAGSLRNMTSNGQVPYYKLGRRNRYRLSDLHELLLSQKRGS